MEVDLIGLIEAAREVFTNFKSGIFIGLSGLLYVIVQVLRGKAGFKIPFITNKFNAITSSSLKTYIILSLFALIGGCTALSTGTFTFNSVLDSVLAGITLGLGTIGFRTVSKNTMESDGFKTFTGKLKAEVAKKDDQPK